MRRSGSEIRRGGSAITSPISAGVEMTGKDGHESWPWPATWQIRQSEWSGGGVSGVE
jgi:hypothetical protein